MQPHLISGKVHDNDHDDDRTELFKNDPCKINSQQLNDRIYFSHYLFFRSHLKRLFPCEWLSLAVLRLSGELSESMNVVMFMFLVIHVSLTIQNAMI